MVRRLERVISDKASDEKMKALFHMLLESFLITFRLFFSHYSHFFMNSDQSFAVYYARICLPFFRMSCEYAVSHLERCIDDYSSRTLLTLIRQLICK